MVRRGRGVWWSPGVETGPFPLENGAPIQCHWCYVKYACDFIKDDGKWYIWHMASMMTFYSTFEKSWSEGCYLPPELDMHKKPAGFEADGPSYLRSTAYDPKSNRPYLPAAPEPYETYDESQVILGWVDPNPERKPAWVPTAKS